MAGCWRAAFRRRRRDANTECFQDKSRARRKMILSPPTRLFLPPYNSADPTLCMGNGLLNPCTFSQILRQHPWFPFEDLVFEHDQIAELLRLISGPLFRQTMPCRGTSINYYEIINPNRDDVTQVENWLSHDEGIIWSPSGGMIINIFSDAVILTLPNKLYLDVFGVTGEMLFEQSESVFRSCEASPSIRTFMEKVRDTWH